LLFALHARPWQVVENIKAVVKALLQHPEDVALAVRALMDGGLEGKTGVYAGHKQFWHAKVCKQFLSDLAHALSLYPFKIRSFTGVHP
jgi:hypothetical protein